MKSLSPKIITFILILSTLILLMDSGVVNGDFGQFHISASLSSPTSINLSWPATCIWGECTSYYHITRNWEYLIEVYDTTYSDENLDPGTEYCYRVFAYFDFSSLPFSSYLACVTTPGVLTLKVPTTKQTFVYPPVVVPHKSTHPSLAMPLGIGPIALNGDTLSVSINAYQFSSPVDIYCGYMLSTDPQTVFNLKSDFSFQALSLDQANEALSTGQNLVGAEPLIRNAIGPIDISPLETMQVTDLPSGLFDIYLLVTPTGSFQSYYLWETYFSLPRLQNTVWAWGGNDYGQLGDGTTTDRSTPVQASVLSSITAIAAGEQHTVALRSDGTVWVWGANYFGQLGDGTIISRSAPMQVSGLNDVIAVSAGTNYTVALKSDGTVWDWGYNWLGQLGDGTATDRHTPVQVSDLNGVIAVAAGTNHTVALKSDGTVWDWGDNAAGQLGDGTTAFYSYTPVQVSGLSGVTAIAAGLQHTIALKSDGTVWTWGSNGYGELGVGGTIWNSHTPIQVSGLSGVVAIAAGGFSTYAVKSDGTVWAWGRNYIGQLGDGTKIDRATPVQTIGISDVVAIAARCYAVALKSDGSVWSWVGGEVKPVQVGLSGVVAIAAGGSHTVVLK